MVAGASCITVGSTRITEKPVAALRSYTRSSVLDNMTISHRLFQAETYLPRSFERRLCVVACYCANITLYMIASVVHEVLECRLARTT